MPAWCSSPDGQAARGEIENESKKRGWDRLSNTSSTVQKANGEAERREFIPYPVCQYPAAEKDTTSWLRFIKNTTGQVKEWKSVSTAEGDQTRIGRRGGAQAPGPCDRSLETDQQTKTTSRCKL